MTPEEARDAMEQYANTGRVVTGPAAPGGSARTMSEKEKKEFDGECTSLCATYAYALVWK